MNFDLVSWFLMMAFSLLVCFSVLFLSVRYCVCLARSERRTPWSFPLGFGWLMLFLSVFIPGRVTDVPWEENLPSDVAGTAFAITITLLWCWATVAYLLTASNWRQRKLLQRFPQPEVDLNR